MHIKVCVLVFVVIYIYISSFQVVAGTFYKYEDNDGNLHFTDNLANTPRSKINNLEIVERKSSNLKTSKTNTKDSTPKAQINKFTSESDGSWDSELIKKAEELEQRQENLNQEYNILQNKKQELQESMMQVSTEAEKSALKDQVSKLNKRIEKYHKKRNNFSQEVNEYNLHLDRLKSDEQNDSER